MSTLHVKQGWLALGMAGLLLLSGCAFGQAAAVQETEPAKTEVMIAAPEDKAPVDEAASGEVASAPPAEARVELYASTATPAEMADVMPETDRAGVTASESVVVPQQAAALRAGEVDDNKAWDDYLLYRRQYQGIPVHNRDVSERYIIEVKDGQGIPVLGATVRFLANGQTVYEAHTYANGQVMFYPLALNLPLEQVERFQVEVEKDRVQENLSLARFNSQVSTSFNERWTVTLDSQAQAETINLDVLFLIDATGSMADEIAQIQNTIFDVAAQIDALPGQPQTRYGLVAYRDRGDAFVSQAYEFTPNVDEFSRNLSTVFADGGGDTPESLNEGLHDALHKVEWRGGETVQLIFLVADAPPHLDYEQDYDYAVEMDNAAQRGIKIFPIASSGLDDQGEYIFRQMAQYTQGRFIFLTYAGPTNGGAPGEVTTHHVDDYSVANLDDLLVRLVEEELAYQNPRLAQAQ